VQSICDRAAGTRLYLFDFTQSPPRKLGQCTSGKARAATHTQPTWFAAWWNGAQPQAVDFEETVTNRAFTQAPQGSAAANDGEVLKLSQTLYFACVVSASASAGSRACIW
jgi:hypothetical protein